MIFARSLEPMSRPIDDTVLRHQVEDRKILI